MTEKLLGEDEAVRKNGSYLTASLGRIMLTWDYNIDWGMIHLDPSEEHHLLTDSEDEDLDSFEVSAEELMESEDSDHYPDPDTDESGRGPRETSWTS